MIEWEAFVNESPSSGLEVAVRLELATKKKKITEENGGEEWETSLRKNVQKEERRREREKEREKEKEREREERD